MAVLKLSSLVNQISGKINGTVFSKTKYGQIAKNNAFSLPQFSNIQTVRQKQIQIVASNWQMLSSSQKQDWENQTVNYPYTNKVGETVYYNGYQLFLMLNNNLLQANLPFNLLVPPFVAVNNLAMNLTNLTFFSVQFNYNSGVVGTKIMLYGSKPLLVGQSFKLSELRLFGTFTVSAGNVFQEMGAQYHSVFGNPAVGTEIVFYAKVIATSTGVNTGLYFLVRGLVT